MIFQELLLFAATTGALGVLAQTIGANVYDMRAIKLQRQISLHPHARKYRHRPLLSIIIPTHNDAAAIGDCLNSLLQSSYRKLEIIVVDSASQDGTKKIVKQWIQEQPKRAIRLSAKRTAAGGLAALETAYKHATGELVMVLDPTSQLQPGALANAARHFNTQPTIDVLRLHIKTRPGLSLASLFSEFDNLFRYQTSKFDSVSRSLFAGEVAGTICRSTLFADLLKPVKKVQTASDALALCSSNKQHHTYYAVDAVLSVPPPRSFSRLLKQHYGRQRNRTRIIAASRLLFSINSDYTKLLTWFRLPLAAFMGLAAILAPVLLTYFVYLAFKLHQPDFLVLSWIMLAMLLVFTIWGDDQLGFRQKLRYLLLTPVTFSWLYAVSIVRAVAMLNGLVPLKSKSY